MANDEASTKLGRLGQIFGKLAARARRFIPTQTLQSAQISRKLILQEWLNIVGVPPRTLLDQIPAAVWTTDKALMITTSMGAGLLGLGLQSGQLEGTSLYQFLGSDDPEHPSVVQHKQALAGKTIKFDGAWLDRIFESILQPLKDESGRITGVIGIAIDVTERRAAEGALRRKQEELNTILDASPAYIWYKDHDNKILRVNRPAAESIGLPVSEIEGHYTDEFYPEEAARYRQDDNEVLQTGKPKLNIVEPYVLASGEKRWVRTDKVPYRDEHGRPIGVIVFSLDVTERKRAEEALLRLADQEKQARHEAERLSRLKDEFLITLSHELRTPLMPILGWTDLLIGGTLDEDSTTKALNTIERNAKVELQLIEDLLDTSRIITGKLLMDRGSVDLTSVAYGAIETVQMAAEAKGIEIELTTGRPPSVVTGDATRLRQVLWNLLSNAVKFTPKGGHIKMHVGRQASCAVVTVSDSGVGIDSAFLPHLFERFRQADSSTTRAFGGLGIGLALVRHIVEAHGGTVIAESLGVNQGATFTVSLPIQALRLQPAGASGHAAKAASDNLTAEKSARLAGLKILVVDDMEDDRSLLLHLLRQHGAEAVAAASTAEALTALARWPAQVLISDIGMPGEDGYALIRKIRSSASPSREIPAIALTAYAGVEEKGKALDAGFQTHMTKPAEPLKLITTVAELAQRPAVP